MTIRLLDYCIYSIQRNLDQNGVGGDWEREVGGWKIYLDVEVQGFLIGCTLRISVQEESTVIPLGFDLWYWVNILMFPLLRWARQMR